MTLNVVQLCFMSCLSIVNRQSLELSFNYLSLKDEGVRAIALPDRALIMCLFARLNDDVGNGWGGRGRM
jgi:hypothetical protein